MNRFSNRWFNTIPCGLRLQGIVVLLSILFFTLQSSAKIKVDKIDPPHWWVGMHDTSLQLQVYGKGIKNAIPSIEYPGVSIDSVVRLDGSPNWQFVYLSISPETKPGKFSIFWRDGKQKVKASYELRARKLQKGANGYDASDLLYLIMPDRFADGNPENNTGKGMKFGGNYDRENPHARHGGDLQGILDHIGYLDSLGITAVWVNPVLENDMPRGSYHGYATTDYYKIDPRFGTNQEYVQLIDTLHQRGIKTIMDMIFNHSGSEHLWIKDLPSKDWINHSDGYQPCLHKLSTISDPYASDIDRAETQQGWFVEEMPDLNQLNPHLMKYLVQNSIWWIEEAQIDAIRMDTYPYADEFAMADWINRVMEEYPNFNIVGECWFGNPALNSWWQKDSPAAKAIGFNSELPSVMDFYMVAEEPNLKLFCEQTDYAKGLNRLYDHHALDFLYADPMKVLRFLDNHDSDRLIHEMPETLDNWKQGIAYLMTVPGVPQIYYGTELLMSGTRAGDDGNVRKDMPGGFPFDMTNCFNESGRTSLQQEAWEYIAKIANWRKNNKAVRIPGMKHFVPVNGVYVYMRGTADNPVIVLLNGMDNEVQADMSRYSEVLKKGAKYKDVVTGKSVVLWPEGNNLSIAPRAAMILELSK